MGVPHLRGLSGCTALKSQCGILLLFESCSFKFSVVNSQMKKRECHNFWGNELGTGVAQKINRCVPMFTHTH